MDQHSFFDEIEKQYQSKLPFVVYSRPINSIVKCWLQKTDTLYTVEDFSESGFVFSPFNLNKNSILFPLNQTDYHSVTVENFDVKKSKSQNYTPTEKEEQTHKSLVQKGINHIINKDFKKVVLSRRIEVEIDSPNPIELFKKLFNSYKNAMVYCWYHPKVGLWLGATPELLFKLERSKLTTISLAGTIPHSEVSQSEWTDKEKDEQQIVTDFIISQIKPYSNNIMVSDPETIRAGSLTHLKTRVVADVSLEKNSLASIVQALHPTPAVCGFPKKEVQNFILNNEGYNREFYTGFLGELNLFQKVGRNPNRRNVEHSAYTSVSRQSNFYVNLRCMQIIENKAYVYVGGGITGLSDPEKEWLETVSKSQTILSIL